MNPLLLLCALITVQSGRNAPQAVEIQQPDGVEALIAGQEYQLYPEVQKVEFHTSGDIMLLGAAEAKQTCVKVSASRNTRTLEHAGHFNRTKISPKNAELLFDTLNLQYHNSARSNFTLKNGENPSAHGKTCRELLGKKRIQQIRKRG